MTAAAPRPVPEVGPPRPLKLPRVQERLLDNGLRVLAVRKPGVPRFEARLRIPIARRRDTADPARQRLLAGTLLAGTTARDALAIQQTLQRLGGTLEAAVDAEEAAVSASGMATSLRPVLELVADVLVDASFPSDEVALERERATQELLIGRSQPDVIAAEVLLGRLYGSHPFGRGLPTPEEMDGVTPAALRRYARQRLLPAGAALVLVGDVAPGKAIDEAARAFEGWTGDARSVGLPAPQPPPRQPTVLVDRPGAVQTTIRLAVRVPGRSDPRYPALAVAVTAFGGYISSRLAQNIREDKGYTYSPSASMNLNRAASHVTVSADVGTEVTAPALLETRYELGRMATTLLDDDELRSARRYLQGIHALTGQTQAGLASQLSRLVAFGLPVEELRALPAALERVTAEEVREAAAAYLAPARMLSVLVGDAGRVRAGVETLDDVTT